MKKNIFAISGSTRKNASNEAILQIIGNLFEKQINMDIYEGIDRLPHFNPDLDHEHPPASVVNFRQRIEAADGVIICTPEYVFSLPGSLKNALEWNVSTNIFSDKPVGFIIASASGEKAFESLQLVMSTIEARIPAGATLLIKGAKGKIGKNGEMKDHDTLLKIEDLMKCLLQSMDT